MENKQINDYMQLGALLQFLIHLQEGVPIHGEKMTIYAIEDFLELLEALNFQVSSRASWRLREIVKDLKQREENSVLSKEDADELERVTLSIRNTIRAEGEGFELFATTPKRLDMVKLLHDPAALFAPHVFSVVEELTRYDLIEAAKCVTFECPTAAAFHILRATENVLRGFYVQHVIRGRIRSLNWGPIVNDLRIKLPRKRNIPKDMEILLNQLDYIRQQFRNPTQHPDKIYDIQEVQDLWSLCVDVINRMTK